MTADSSRELVDPDHERPLFRLGSPAHRMEALGHTLFLLLSAFGAAGVLQGAVVEGLAVFGVTEASAPALVSLVGMGAQFAGFLGVSIVYLVVRDDNALVEVSALSLRDLAVIAFGAVFLVGTLTGLEWLFAQFGLQPPENVATTAGERNPRFYLYVIPVVLFLNSPGEELLFRGLIQGQFRRAYGVVPGVVAAATVFGLIHYLALVGTGSEIVYVTIAAVAGLILGAVYEYTTNLLVPIVIHALWNTGVYLVLYLDAVRPL